MVDEKKPAEFPKWVKVHESHIERKGDTIAIPGFPEFYRDRAGEVTVLVPNADEERRAGSERKPAEDHPAPPKESGYPI